MRKFCGWTMVMCGVLVAGLIVTATPQQAQARPWYLAWWGATYPETAKKDEVKSQKCNVCHVGVAKKNRNDYGKAIAKALAPNKTLKKSDANKEIFQTALKTVAKQASATEGKTFGDLIEAGQLPSQGK